MLEQPKYISFPLFLISGLPENLGQIFDYGIYRFAKTIKHTDLNAVYTQVMYGYYRRKLPAALLSKINSLIEEETLMLDEDYNGFYETEFDPEMEVAELSKVGSDDQNFQDGCIEYWQIRQALQILEIEIKSLDRFINNALSAKYSIDDWENKGGKDVTVMMSVRMMFEYYNKDKSEYEIDLLRAFLSIKSILGKKVLVGTTKDYILTRMIGARKKELLPKLLKVRGLKLVYDKYKHRYHIDKLLSELLARGFITGKLGFNRRIYISTHFTTSQLPDQILELLLKNNTKIKRDKNAALEKEARIQLQKLIRSNLTAP